MLHWLQLSVLLLLSATTSGREIKCDRIGHFSGSCWSSQLNVYVDCRSCVIKNQRISDKVLTILPQYRTGKIADVQIVRFDGSRVTQLPKVILKTTKQQILKVQIFNNGNHVLNAQFFENDAQNMTDFLSSMSYNVGVEAFTFRNCPQLVELVLEIDGKSPISPDAFRGLHKLTSFRLSAKQQLHENWLLDLGNLEIMSLKLDQMEEMPDTTFDELRKLKRLHLIGNTIEVITRKMFRNNLQLQEIRLNDNQIVVIESGAFEHLNKLTLLALDGNKCIDKTFNNNTAEEITEGLTVCYPTNCVIPQIANGYVVNTENNIRQIPGDSLEPLDSVKVACDHTFLLFHKKETQQANICTEDDWTSQEWPTCQRE